MGGASVICSKAAEGLCIKTTGLGKKGCEQAISNVCEVVAEKVFCDVKPITNLDNPELQQRPAGCDPNTQSCGPPPEPECHANVSSDELVKVCPPIQ